MSSEMEESLIKHVKKSRVITKSVGLFFVCYLSVFALETYRSGNNQNASLSFMPSSRERSMISKKGTSMSSLSESSMISKEVTSTKFKLAMMHEKRHLCIQHIRRDQYDTLGDVLIQDRVDRWGNMALFVDPAYHPNVGDHLLTLAGIEYLRSLGWGKETHRLKECSVCQAGRFAAKCSFEKKDYYSDINLAVWQAGGNWGNLWHHVHQARLETFGPLLKYGKTIVHMPASLHYDVDRGVKEETDTLFMRKEIAKGLGLKDHLQLDTFSGKKLAQSRVILTWRDFKSYHSAIKLYPFVSNRLMPDLAFQMGPFIPSMRPDNISGTTGLRGQVEHPVIPKILPEKVDLLLFMREDYESKEASTEEMKKDGGRRSYEYWRNYLDNLPSGRGEGVTFQIVDWADRYDIFQDTSSMFSQTAVDLLHVGRVVVADRLHASILAFLSDAPLIYIDQRTKKVSGALEVAFTAWEGCRDEDTLMYQGAESFEDGINKALDMIDANNLRDLSN